MDIKQVKIEIGLRIKSFRKSNNMTQEDLSQLIDLNLPNISKIENGKSYPEFNTVCSLIEKGGMEPNFLFGFLSDKNKNYSSIDIDIMNKIVNLNNSQKQILHKFLIEFIQSK